MFKKMLLAVSGRNSGKTIDKKLLRFTAFKNRFRYFILVENQWQESIYDTDRFFTLDQHQEISNPKDYIITYRNGDFVEESREFEYYPDEVTSIEEGECGQDVYSKEMLTEGNKLFEVRFSKSPVYPEDSNYYKLSITNKSTEKIQVLKFAGFEKITGDQYKLNTVTGDFFSASDFNNWYMDSPERWINPNETVFDPISYGGDDGFWAYQAKTESGDTVWFGTN